MSLLSTFFATPPFKDFEDKLERFLLLDKELSILVEEIEQKSLITTDSFLFKKRVIDVSKIDKKKIEILLNLFESFEKIEMQVISDFQKNKVLFFSKNEKIALFIEQYLGTLFQHIKNAKVMFAEIREYLAEFKPEELKDDFDNLNKELHEIRQFIEVIQAYTKQIEREKKEKHFLEVVEQKEDSLFISKLRKYVSDIIHIRKTQEEILTLPVYSKKHHEVIKMEFIKIICMPGLEIIFV